MSGKLLTKVQELIWSLQGHKTYILGAATTVINIVVVLYPNLLSPQQLLKLDGILVALGGMALHAAVVRE